MVPYNCKIPLTALLTALIENLQGYGLAPTQVCKKGLIPSLTSTYSHKTFLSSIICTFLRLSPLLPREFVKENPLQGHIRATSVGIDRTGILVSYIWK